MSVWGMLGDRNARSFRYDSGGRTAPVVRTETSALYLIQETFQGSYETPVWLASDLTTTQPPS